MKPLIVASLALVLAACGSMNVTVSVLNPTVVETEEDRTLVRYDLPTVSALTNETTASQYDRACELRTNVLRALAAQNRLTAATEAKRKDRLLKEADSVEQRIIPRLQQRCTREGEAVAAIEAQIRGLRPEQTTAIATLLRQRAHRRADFAQLLSDGVRQSLRDAADSALDVTIRAQVAEDANAIDNLLIGKANLTGVRAAYAVSAAEPGLWAPIFDKSIATGRFGKVDLAIKMESRGVFTIKGVTFDPAEVARVASKATTQALLVSAQIAGVPVSRKATTGDGSALATSSSDLADAEQQTAQAADKLADRNAALHEIANAIFANRPGVEGADDASLRAALAAIKASIDSNKARLTN